MARGKSRQNDGRNPIGRGKSKTLPIGAGNNVSNSLPIGATASNNGLTSTPIGSLLIRATTCIGPTSIPASVGEIGSTSHTIVAGSASVSLPTGASNNGSTSIPMGVGDNGSASQAANVSNNEPASQAANVSNNGPASQAANVSNNGPASQAANVSNNGPASLPLANEPETEESVEPNSHGSVGNENVNANCINQPSMYDAVNVNRTVNGRKAIQVIANEIWPSCARTMREIFKLKVDPNGCAWKYISAETKDFYFEEYRKRVYWDESMEALVKRAWEAKTRTRYNEMLTDANNKKKRLDFIPQNIWDEWQTYFTGEEFLRISKRNSENRKKANNGAGPSSHVGGSIPHVEHAKRLEKKLGRDPTFPEIFRQLHTRKQDGVTFVDDKAREVNERVTKLHEHRLEQQEDIEQIDESQIYVEAVQGKRSDRIYGIGSVGKLYRNNECSTSASMSSSTSTSTSTSTSGIEQQVQQLVDQRVEEVLDEKVEN